jgi:hypothetical protein
MASPYFVAFWLLRRSLLNSATAGKLAARSGIAVPDQMRHFAHSAAIRSGFDHNQFGAWC